MAFSNRKPQPLMATPARRLCAICGTPSYSQSGVHPQCAAKQASAVIRAAEKKTEDEAPLKPSRPQWLRKWVR